jgi:hypothetical protein
MKVSVCLAVDHLIGDRLAQIIGMLYLHETLCPVINEVFKERKACELDPGRIDVHRK